MTVATITFRGEDLLRQVEHWANENGLVLAPGCVTGAGTNTRGMMPAEQYSSVAKWRNLTQEEKDACWAVAVFSGDSVVIEQRVVMSAPRGG